MSILYKNNKYIKRAALVFFQINMQYGNYLTSSVGKSCQGSSLKVHLKDLGCVLQRNDEHNRK